MERKPAPLIDPEGLVLLPGGSFILIDAGPSRGRYEKMHLEGAAFADLNTDLADVPDDFAQGGRHPLPTPERFGRVLGRLGITPESHVVVYDDKNGANPAARFWWMLRAAGHDNVQVLNGGLQAAVEEGWPATDRLPIIPPADDYIFTRWQLPTAAIDEVEAAASDGHSVVIDVRDPERFNGITEPIDLVAGHIPGAVNVPFSSNLDAGGRFLPPAALRAKYGMVMGEAGIDNVIVHCGSGVTACHTLLALDYAGQGIPKLYTGSWSEWSGSGRSIGRNV